MTPEGVLAGGISVGRPAASNRQAVMRVAARRWPRRLPKWPHTGGRTQVGRAQVAARVDTTRSTALTRRLLFWSKSPTIGKSSETHRRHSYRESRAPRLIAFRCRRRIMTPSRNSDTMHARTETAGGAAKATHLTPPARTHEVDRFPPDSTGSTHAAVRALPPPDELRDSRW